MDSYRPTAIHVEDPQLFREAVRYTEAQTGFSAQLIEKDYFCSLVLHYLYFDVAHEKTPLVFKGGTCLSKVYVNFYRLSEDLDFVISLDSAVKREKRRKEIAPLKDLFTRLPSHIPSLTMKENLKGHNESKQYIGYVEYVSSLISRNEQIKIEIGLREPLIKSPAIKPAKSILLNPFTRKAVLQAFPVQAIDVKESYAEKTRAALSRKEPAIRDFYDILHAQRVLGINFVDKEFLGMVRKKLLVPGNHPVDVSAERKSELQKQVQAQLRSVLRHKDFDTFDLDEAFDIVNKVAEKIK